MRDDKYILSPIETVGAYYRDAEGFPWTTFTVYGVGVQRCEACGRFIKQGFVRGQLGDQFYFCGRHIEVWLFEQGERVHDVTADLYGTVDDRKPNGEYYVAYDNGGYSPVAARHLRHLRTHSYRAECSCNACTAARANRTRAASKVIAPPLF